MQNLPLIFGSEFLKMKLKMTGAHPAGAPQLVLEYQLTADSINTLGIQLSQFTRLGSLQELPPQLLSERNITLHHL